MSPKKIFIVSLLVTIVVGFFCISNLVLADEFGLQTTAGAAGLMRGQQDLPTLAGNILGTALSFIGVLFFALMVFGGFMWMTARGNEEQTKKALNTITAAVIGLIIVLSSYTITSFVFKSVGIQKGGSASVSDGGTGADAACLAFEGFSCNEITDCSNINITNKITTIEIKYAQALCEANGTSNCKTGLCGRDNTRVCCKPKDPSEEKTQWCFDKENFSCIKLATVGKANCNTDNKFIIKNDGTKWGNGDSDSDIGLLTEKECYEKCIDKYIKDIGCNNDNDCKKEKTNYYCKKESSSSKCTEIKNGTIDKICVSTKDCVDSICKNVQNVYKCVKGKSSSNAKTVSDPANTHLLYCREKPSDGDDCTKGSQCESGFCVEGQCRSGDTCSICKSDADCKENFICNTMTNSSPKGCIPKLENGERCFGTNSVCKSGICKDLDGDGSPYNVCTPN